MTPPLSRPAFLVAPWALVLVACSQSATWVIQVRSDLLPERELAAVDVVLTSSTGETTRTRTEASSARDWGAGVRVAEVAGLALGRYVATIAAVDASGESLVERRLAVQIVSGLRVTTVLLTRDCQGVRCPLDGGDPNLVACLGGRCVPEGCSEDDPSACGTPVCASDAECPAAAGGCATAECTASGTCLASLDHSACGAGEVCSARLGCTPEECDWVSFTDPRPIAELNLDDTQYGASASTDGLTLFFTSGSSPPVLTMASRPDRSSPYGPTDDALEDGLLTAGAEPSISSDGLRLYLSADLGGTVRLYLARRATTAERFGSAEALEMAHTGETFEAGPDLSADERILVFSAGGWWDEPQRLFIETRTGPEAAFGAPVEITGLAGEYSWGFPSISADGLTLFYVSGLSDASRLYVARRASRDEPFSGGELVTGVDGPDLEEDPDISPDGSELFYNATDATGASELYVATRACTP